jgi:ornithine carbamoyltransferase
LKEVDFTKDEFLYLIDLAAQLREDKRRGSRGGKSSPGATSP